MEPMFRPGVENDPKPQQSLQGAHGAPARERKRAAGPAERPSRGMGRSPIQD